MKDNTKILNIEFTGSNWDILRDQLKEPTFSKIQLNLLETDLTELNNKQESLLCSALQHPNVVGINFKNSDFNDEGFLLLSKAIEENPNLLTLDLTNTGLNEDNLKIIITALLKHKSIKNLCLASNNLNLENLAGLPALVTEVCLETLDLSYNSLGKNANTFTEFFSFLRVENTNIKNLILAKTDLKIDALLKLLSLLAKHKVIESLDVSHNVFQVDNDNQNLKTAFQNFFSDNSQFRRLNLSNANFNSFLTDLNDVLLLPSGTIELDLSHNSSRCLLEIDRLCSAMVQNKVKSLNLSYNHFDFDAFNKFLKSLTNNKSLKSLNLSHCHIDKKYSKLLAGIIPKILNLREINLDGNDIPDSRLKAIANALKASKKIHSLSVSNNNLTKTSTGYLYKLLTDNASLTSLPVVGIGAKEKTKQVLTNLVEKNAVYQESSNAACDILRYARVLFHKKDETKPATMADFPLDIKLKILTDLDPKCSLSPEQVTKIINIVVNKTKHRSKEEFLQELGIKRLVSSK